MWAETREIEFETFSIWNVISHFGPCGAQHTDILASTAGTGRADPAIRPAVARGAGARWRWHGLTGPGTGIGVEARVERYDAMLHHTVVCGLGRPVVCECGGLQK